MTDATKLVAIDTGRPIWDRMFTVAPLIVVGTREPDGSYDFAPKHMAMPLGWSNYFGFVCTPEHATYRNIQRERCFTITFPIEAAIVSTSLSASPRCEDQSKPALQALRTFAAEIIDGRLLEQGSLFLECQLDRIIDGFGINSLIAGKVVAARARPEALRSVEVDDQDTLAASPVIAYLSPGRYLSIDHSFSFPFPQGFRRSKEDPK
jgi:flavin reductase (DIM6/NTAB) family NADH-FMN oxidoreductase RutF